jgi:hypothetical protein
MTFAKDDLIAALRTRYDHYSAQAVFEMARDRAGLPDKPAFDAGELRTWRDSLAAVGDRVTGVLARIDALLATAGAPSADGGGKHKAEAAAMQGAAQQEPVPTKQEVAKPEPAKHEPTKLEPAKPQPVKPDVGKPELATPEKPVEASGSPQTSGG